MGIYLFHAKRHSRDSCGNHPFCLPNLLWSKSRIKIWNINELSADTNGKRSQVKFAFWVTYLQEVRYLKCDTTFNFHFHVFMNKFTGNWTMAQHSGYKGLFLMLSKLMVSVLLYHLVCAPLAMTVFLAESVKCQEWSCWDYQRVIRGTVAGYIMLCSSFFTTCKSVFIRTYNHSLLRDLLCRSCYPPKYSLEQYLSRESGSGIWPRSELSPLPLPLDKRTQWLYPD